jgi:hypothetical protein
VHRHQRAVVGALDYLPVTRGGVQLLGATRTDFLWSLALEAR